MKRLCILQLPKYLNLFNIIKTILLSLLPFLIDMRGWIAFANLYNFESVFPEAILPYKTCIELIKRELKTMNIDQPRTPTLKPTLKVPQLNSSCTLPNSRRPSINPSGHYRRTLELALIKKRLKTRGSLKENNSLYQS